MKQSPDYAKAQENMQAGEISAEGFLGDDTRSLTDIIEKDEESFASLGMDFDEVADTLESLLKAGQAGLGEPITVEDDWLVRTDEARGFIPSPFGGKVFHKVNVEVTRKSNKKSLLFSELSLHMLKEYHFLEGKGSTFRMEPAQIKEVLY